MPPKTASRKRRRVDSNALVAVDPIETTRPIIFETPGLKPDTRLDVLGQPIYVHSIILKLHSNFFRRFLDSPDKSGRPASASFQYEYISVIDKDGDWALEPAEKATVTDATLEPLQQFRELDCFEMLLRAMYNRPYRIGRVIDLRTITRLADFYCALPIVSSTIGGALIGSPIFRTTINPWTGGWHSLFAYQSSTLIFDALKLRNAAFFRECFIHIVACWAEMKQAIEEGRTEEDDNEDNNDVRDFGRLKSIFPTKRLMSHPLITPLIKDAYAELREKTLDTSQKFIATIVGKHWEVPLPTFYDSKQDAVFYKTLQLHLKQNRSFERPPEMVALERSVAALLKNYLSFNEMASPWRSEAESGIQQQFLCSYITDEDMPWDSTETDW